MKKNIWIWLLLIATYTFGQQDSKIKIDSGNNNKVTVIQQGNDSNKKSDVEIFHSDSNNLNIEQRVTDTKEEVKGFMYYINNIYTISLLILTLTGIFTYFKTRKKSSRKK